MPSLISKLPRACLTYIPRLATLHLELIDIHQQFQRLFSPLLFTLAICGGSYYFAQNWKPAPIQDRWFPDIPQSFTTVAVIIATNCAIFLAWKVPLPMSWRLLNKYFISVPALPYSFSIIGNVFSHQTVLHLGMNMFVIDTRTPPIYSIWKRIH